MPNPRDVIQVIDAVTGDLLWQHNRDRPDDLADYMIGTVLDVNRDVAIYRARPALPPEGELGASSSRRRPARTHVR